MKTAEGNQLINEFMKNKSPKIVWPECYYHNSWDWLMPVVEKIENLKVNIKVKSPSLSGDYVINHFRLYITFGSISINGIDKHIIAHSKIISSVQDFRISIYPVWKVICEFITWYNENKDQEEIQYDKDVKNDLYGPEYPGVGE